MSAITRDRMEIVMISPDVEKDGVAKYTGFLSEKLEKLVDIDELGIESVLSLSETLKLSWKASEYDLTHIQFTPSWWGNIFGYFWGSYMIPFLLFARSKTVLTAHEYEFDHGNPVVYKIQELKNRIIYSLADKVIVHNERGKESIHDFAPRADIEVIPHGLPEVEEPDEELDLDGKVILIFGFIRQDKDYEAAFDALEKLPDDYKLLVAGSARTEEDEEYEQELKQEVTERGLDDRVTFYGYV
ncbi:MAG: glycosyltransferase, partial [Halobacteriaceae archaeon]